MSRAAPAIPLFGDAYLADTRHLSLEEHGAYLVLMMIAWRSPDCALPNDDSRIVRMLGVTPKKWAALKHQVMAFWDLEECGWQQKRLLKECRWVAKKSFDNSASARARWNANALKTNKVVDANAMRDACMNDAPPPPPTSLDKSNDEDSDFQFWKTAKDFIAGEAKQPGAMIGKWRKDYGQEAVGAAITRAQLERPVQRIPFIVGCLRHKVKVESDWSMMP